MPTLAAGRVVSILWPTDGQITITPGSAGRVSLNARGRDGSQSIAPREVYNAETINVSAGDTVILEAINTDATYTSPVSGDGASVETLRVGQFGAGAVVNGILLTQISMGKTKFNQIRLNWTATSASTYFEVAIYSASMSSILCRSGVREHPVATGVLPVALPETTLEAGTYWVALASGGATAAVSVTGSGEVFARTSALTLPLPTAIPAGSSHSATGLSFALEYVALVDPATPSTLTTGAVRVYGNNPANSQPWGWNTATARLCYSANSGASWVDAMTYPPITAGAPIDMTVNGGRLYLLTSECELWVTSDLTSTATWQDISVPIATGWRRSIAKGRPYGMIVWNDWLFVGEYTSGVDMDSDPNWQNDQAGPRVFRYGPLSGTPAWVVSKAFNSSRHVHSFFSPGASWMMVSLGDLGQWTNGKKTGQSGISADVGIHRITAITPGGPDTWVDWTSNTAPCTTHYPVDFLTVAGRADAADGVYGASDSVGIHLQYFRISGGPGQFNTSAQAFRQNTDPGETVRSLTLDPATGNLYYWTVETADPGIYVSPPPYTQAKRLFSVPMTAAQVRAIVSGGFILHFDQRISLCKFPWQ